MDWIKKSPEQFTCVVDGRWKMQTTRMGDRRWSWSICVGESQNPTATGIGNSLGAAKQAMENFLQKNGFR